MEQEVRLQPGEVHAGRALRLAGLARKAQVERPQDALLGLRAGGEPAVEQRPHQVRPAAGRVFLLAGRHEGRAHRPAEFLPADAGAVAQFHRAGEPLLAAVGEHHRQLHRLHPLAVAEVVGHRRGVHHLPRVHDPLRVEGGLQPAERLVHAGAEHLLVEVAARQPVPVLAAHGTAEVEDEVADLPRQLLHLADFPWILEVDERADVEAAGPGVRVETALRGPPGEDLLEPGDELREARRFHRGVLDEGDGLLVAGEAEQQRERRLPHFPHIGLRRRVEEPQHRLAAPPEPPLQPRHPGSDFAAARPGELHQDERLRLAAHEPQPPGVLERLPRHAQDGPVHQFHRARPEFERFDPRFQRRQEAVEVEDGQPHRRRQPVEADRRLDHDAERPLRADHQVRQVDARGVEQDIQVVAGDAARDAGEPLPDVLPVLVADGSDRGADARHRVPGGAVPAGEGGGSPADLLPAHPAEAFAGAVREDHRGLEQVLDGLPVHQRPGAGGVVADHPAQVRPVGGGGLRAEPEPQRRESGAQGVLHHAGLDPRPEFFAVHFQDPPEVGGEVEDHRLAHRLSGERSAAAAGEHRRAGLGRGPHRLRHIASVAGDHHPQRLDLVDARVGRVEEPRGPVEADPALDPGGERARQFAPARGHAPPRIPSGSGRSRAPGGTASARRAARPGAAPPMFRRPAGEGDRPTVAINCGRVGFWRT